METVSGFERILKGPQEKKRPLKGSVVSETAVRNHPLEIGDKTIPRVTVHQRAGALKLFAGQMHIAPFICFRINEGGKQAVLFGLRYRGNSRGNLIQDGGPHET